MSRTPIGKGFRPQDYKDFDDQDFDDPRHIISYTKVQRNHLFVNWWNEFVSRDMLSYIREGDKVHMFIGRIDLDLIKHRMLDWEKFKRFCVTAVYESNMKLNIHLPIIADEEYNEVIGAFIKSLDSTPGLTGLCNFIKSDKPTLFKYNETWIGGYKENYIDVCHDSEIGLYQASKYIPEENQ